MSSNIIAMGVLEYLEYPRISCNTHRLEIDLSGLMRGDPAQRWAAWKIAVEANILTPDEVRQEEGWNPRPAQV
jgi:phage portal protein BeeE